MKLSTLSALAVALVFPAAAQFNEQLILDEVTEGAEDGLFQDEPLVYGEPLLNAEGDEDEDVGDFFYEEEAPNFDFEAEHHRGNECDKKGEGCPVDRWCDTDTRLCWPKRVSGERCNNDIKCFSNRCVEDECAPVDLVLLPVDNCLGVLCPFGQVCDAGECYVDLCTQVRCRGGFYCDHGSCLNEKGCIADPECPDQYYCDDPTDTCIWIPLCNGDDECEDNGVCRHGNCLDGDELRAIGDECEFNAQCESEFCDEFVFEDTNTNNPQLCRAKKSDGRGCDENFECASDLCLDFECTSTVPCVQDNQCAIGEFCDVTGSRMCEDQLANRGECDRNGQCESGFCDRFVFEDSNTNNPQLCRAKKANGAGCDANFECASNSCVDFECQSALFCARDGDCISNSRYCNLFDNNCDLKLSNGQRCDSNSQCVSELCSGNVCRADPPCARDSQCTSLQFCNLGDNTCDLKLGNRQPCDDDNQCRSGFCNTFISEDGPSLCEDKKQDGQDCNDNLECVSNICFANTCTSKTPVAGACTIGTQCISGLCSCETNRCIASLTPSGGSCESNCECRSGLYCDSGDEGHTDTCTLLERLGGHCHDDSSCLSGRCHVFPCAWGLCGTETCIPIEGSAGDYCVDDSHCKSNRCRGPRGSRTCRDTTQVNRKRLGAPFYGWP